MTTNLQLTMTSIGSIIVFSLLFALFLEFALKNNKLLSSVKYELLLICMTVPILKILIPMEMLPWTKNINVSLGLPKVIIFFNRTLFSYHGRNISLWEMLTTILVIASALNMIRAILSYWHFLAVRESLPDVEDGEIYKLVDKILSEKGRKVTVRIKWTYQDCSPYVYGLLKPTILLPRKEISETGMECILRHELSHYLYGDLIMRFLWTLIKSFCFWNPAVYILDKQFEKILEIRADENSLKGKELEYQKQYLITLVKMSVRKPKKDSAYVTAFTQATKLGVKKRLDIIQNRRSKSKSELVKTNALVCSMIIALGLAMNCLIFEPRGAVPKGAEEEEYVSVMAVDSSNNFFIKNEEGTYDMYVDGIYRATLESTQGSDIKVYESLEEALEYEEIK